MILFDETFEMILGWLSVSLFLSFNCMIQSVRVILHNGHEKNTTIEKLEPLYLFYLIDFISKKYKRPSITLFLVGCGWNSKWCFCHNSQIRNRISRSIFPVSCVVRIT